MEKKEEEQELNIEEQKCDVSIEEVEKREPSKEEKDTGEEQQKEATESAQEIGRTVGKEAAEETPEADEEKPYEDLPTFVTGEKVTGTVVKVTDNEVLVDFGHKFKGIIPLNELSIKPVDSPEEVLGVDDQVEAEIVHIDDEEERIDLSKREIDFDRAWSKVFAKHEKNETVETKVTRSVKGGLIVDLFGLRGFVPGSHVDIRYIEDFDQFIGQTLQFKVIEMEREQNNIVLSRKEVLEEARAEQKEETLAELEGGQIRKGTVKNIVDFGAFVDIGGIDGLLHISEMSWSHIQHPSDVVAEGEEIEVMVLSVDKDSERISLGIKQVQPNPWVGISERYSVGDVTEAEITKLVNFGAFARIEDDIEGLIHISQLAQRHVEKPEEVVSVGDRIKVKVVGVHEDEQKIGLSIKEIDQDEGLGAANESQEEGSGTSIGSIVGDLFNDN